MLKPTSSGQPSKVPTCLLLQGQLSRLQTANEQLKSHAPPAPAAHAAGASRHQASASGSRRPVQHTRLQPQITWETPPNDTLSPAILPMDGSDPYGEEAPYGQPHLERACADPGQGDEEDDLVITGDEADGEDEDEAVGSSGDDVASSEQLARRDERARAGTGMGGILWTMC